MSSELPIVPQTRTLYHSRVITRKGENDFFLIFFETPFDPYFMGSKCVFGVSSGVSVSRNRLIFLLQCAPGTAEWLNRSASADGVYNRNTTSKHGQGWSEVRTYRRSLQKHGSVASSLPVSCRRPTMALRRSGVRLPLSPPLQKSPLNLVFQGFGGFFVFRILASTSAVRAGAIGMRRILCYNTPRHE